MRLPRLIFAITAILSALLAPAKAQGTLPIALQQQFSFTGCATVGVACGQPLNGGLLYFFQVGTVATRQDSFQDTGLTLPNPWPLPLDANGRVPPFYLANGSIHVRLTDANGLVQFDYPSMLVIGPSGGGGGGSSVDPTTIATTADVKFRPFAGSITGWVRLNGLTVGSAVSGATERANSDTQNLYVILWGACDNTHCPVVGGRGGSALADFNANKQLTLPDWRGRITVGLDDMGNSQASRFVGVPFSGADSSITPGAYGGENTHTLVQAELPAVAPTFTGAFNGVSANWGGTSFTTIANGGVNVVPRSDNMTTGYTPSGTISNLGSGQANNDMQMFTLGSWYMKL